MIEDRTIRDIKNLFEQTEEDYCKPVRVGTFYSNDKMEYESNGAVNKMQSIKKYLDETKPYLKDINNLRNLIRGKFN